jgi:Skp family chaperone for outer membrane proteins
MEPSTEYQRFAQECRRLAQQAETEQHSRILEEMAQAWEKLARENDGKGSQLPP